MAHRDVSKIAYIERDGIDGEIFLIQRGKLWGTQNWWQIIGVLARSTERPWCNGIDCDWPICCGGTD